MGIGERILWETIAELCRTKTMTLPLVCKNRKLSRVLSRRVIPALYLERS
jgi:hypothetical protein